MKKLMTLFFVSIAVAGIAVAVFRQWKTDARNRAGPESASVILSGDSESMPPASSSHVVKVTYFTNNVRCPSCLKIEELTHRTVEKHFADQLRDGRVTFQLINVDLPENQHFIEDYKLVSKTVIVAEFHKGIEGDWINLQDVWLKFSDEPAFEAYVAEAVSQFL